MCVGGGSGLGSVCLYITEHGPVLSELNLHPLSNASTFQISESWIKRRGEKSKLGFEV